jgi:hypothetical protein
LVLIAAIVTASFAGLATRKPFYFLPIYWVIGVVSLLIGQVVGRAAGITFIDVGQVALGTGLIVNIGVIVALQFSTVWYDSVKQ